MFGLTKKSKGAIGAFRGTESASWGYLHLRQRKVTPLRYFGPKDQEKGNSVETDAQRGAPSSYYSGAKG